MSADWSIKKAAKKLIKRAKKHPDWYTKEEVRYAKRLEKKLKMKNDSLKINQNEDGSFSIEWDRQDPNWKWLNDLTTQEIEVIIKQAIKYDHDRQS